MKIFKELFTPDTFQITDINGQTHIVNTQFVSTGKSKELEKLIRKMQSGDLKEDETSLDIIQEIMIARCGRDKTFWNGFSIELLTEVANSFNEDAKKKSEIVS